MDSDLLQPGWRERRESVGELSLHWVEAGPEDAPAVFLLHGFPEFWWAWRDLIGPLSQAGLRVIAPDLRGYNHSDAPGGVSAYRLDRLADDVANLAGAIGLERFSVVGHDWGGLVAWAVAGRHGDRVERLAILDAPHPGVLPRFAARHPTQLLRSSYIGWFQLPVLPEAMLSALDFAAMKASLSRTARRGVFTREVLDRYADAWRRPDRLTTMLNYYRALRVPGGGSVGRITAPTLILWGGRDRFLDEGLATASAGMAYNARIVVLNEATHWLHLEEPERIADELRAFLAPENA